MKQTKRIIILTALLLTVSITLPNTFAQGPGFEEDVNDVPVPFDGGVALVAIAAAGYGIKKLKNRKK